MAKKDQDVQKSIKKIEKPLIKLNGLFNSMLDTLSNSNTNSRDKEINQLSKEIDDVIFQEIQGLTKFTGDDISTFLVKLFNEQETANNSMNGIQSMDDIFENESSGIFSFFQDRYKNKNLLYEDLNVITTQLYELKEALLATRDAVVAADEATSSVSRTLKFINSSENDTDKQSYIRMVENMEKEFKLLQKIKNHIVPNSLQYGNYYVYTVPYSKLFQKHYERSQKDKMQLKSTMESVDETFAKEFKTEAGLDSKVQPKVITESFNDVISNIEIYNEEDWGIPLVEGTELSDLMDIKFDKLTKKQAAKSGTASKPMATDGTVDLNSKDADFSGIKECYVKLIDPRKIIPIKILEETIGYYYIHETDLKVSKSPFTTSIKLTANGGNTKDVESAFLSKITDKIVKGFNRKFLEDNVKFKELILNSLIYNDVYKKQLKFQFIPVDYITEFPVNQNEDGEGTSIIYPSLFYAKLYLALLIFKMITIITKSNDQKVYYVKQSGLDNNVANKVQDVARSIKDKQINFMDLMNYNSMVSKIGQGKDVFMPIGRSGEKGIEFDILAGQDVQMNTELMEMLRTAFINATGVPSVIMNYVNEADYAKTLVMANNKFLQRVVSFQMDFNGPVTELYRKILQFSTDMPSEVIAEFEFALTTPKALDTMNMTDLINNSDQVIQFMIKVQTGEQGPQTDDDNLFKDLLYKKYARELMPMLPWNNADKLFEDAKIELVKRLEEKKQAANTDGGDGY